MRLSFAFILFFVLGNDWLSMHKGNATEKQQESICITDSQDVSPCVVVVFGATGDLMARKLLPAIYQLAYEGYLSEHFAMVSFARAKNTHESFRDRMERALQQFCRTQPYDREFWNHFKHQIFYHCSEFENEQGYEKLKVFLAQIDQEFGTKGNRIYYLATAPSYFPIIIEQLSQHHLIDENKGQNTPWSRVIIEKPFGYDLHSATQLQQQISQFLAENQVYRMDHYLGKEGVQNLLAFRFKNHLFEPMWNNQHIDHVQITLAENIGIGLRARFWEETGALGDLLQNHLMQLLALIAMEPPDHVNSASIHQEKIRLLNAIRPFPPLEIENCAVRGQYGPGIIEEEKVPAYIEEKGVAPTSPTETFVAIKLFIDNERWKGVPFYIRGGKRLAKQTTEIAITFKQGPLSSEPNVLFFRIQPRAGVFLKILSKVPGLHDHLQPLLFGYQPETVFGEVSPEAYERMILDCIRGNDHLFVRADEQIAAWRLLTPLLNYWRTHIPEDFPNYEAGSWGPCAADLMLLKQGHQWQILEN
jgi:glucose-6-phosphate 1-dehydrogenase